MAMTNLVDGAEAVMDPYSPWNTPNWMYQYWHRDERVSGTT